MGCTRSPAERFVDRQHAARSPIQFSREGEAAGRRSIEGWPIAGIPHPKATNVQQHMIPAQTRAFAPASHVAETCSSCGDVALLAVGRGQYHAHRALPACLCYLCSSHRWHCGFCPLTAEGRVVAMTPSVAMPTRQQEMIRFMWLPPDVSDNRCALVSSCGRRVLRDCLAAPVPRAVEHSVVQRRPC